MFAANCPTDRLQSVVCFVLGIKERRRRRRQETAERCHSAIPLSRHPSPSRLPPISQALLPRHCSTEHPIYQPKAICGPHFPTCLATHRHPQTSLSSIVRPNTRSPSPCLALPPLTSLPDSQLAQPAPCRAISILVRTSVSLCPSPSLSLSVTPIAPFRSLSLDISLITRSLFVDLASQPI